MDSVYARILVYFQVITGKSINYADLLMASKMVAIQLHVV